LLDSRAGLSFTMPKHLTTKLRGLEAKYSPRFLVFCFFLTKHLYFNTIRADKINYMTPKESITINGGLMAEYKFTVFYEPAEEGGYLVSVPAMPEICTEGDTLEEAREMAEDASRLVIASNIKRGESIPEDIAIDQEPIKEQVVS